MVVYLVWEPSCTGPSLFIMLMSSFISTGTCNRTGFAPNIELVCVFFSERLQVHNMLREA